MDNKDMPAMPTGLIHEDVFNSDGEFCGTVEARYVGLTKLEDFTKAAMQGWLARCSNTPHTVGLDPDEIAKVSISIAKAVLGELDKSSK
jgi:hypothetical protein